MKKDEFKFRTWIPWNGEKLFEDNYIVSVKHRDGSIEYARSQMFDWSHNDDNQDIVEYFVHCRVVPYFR